MKKFTSTLTILCLLFCGATYGQNFAMDDDCYDDYANWAEDCCWNWDDCYWDDYCENPSRVYLGPVFYYRKARFEASGEGEPLLIGNLENRDPRGKLWGVNGGYEYKEICCLYVRADFIWSEGEMRGCGRHRLQEWIVDGRLGYTWGECTPCGWNVTPYVGIGYLWDNRKFEIAINPDDNNGNPGEIDFRARYRAWFIPVGIYGEVEIMCDFTAGLDVTWRPMFDCRVKTDGKVNGKEVVSQDIDLNDGNLSTRYSWRIEVPLRWMICPDWGFEIAVQPFWEHYSWAKVKGEHIMENDEIKSTIWGLPSFRENAWGSKFLIGFRF